MAKFVGYDCFNTMRIRYTDGTILDTAYMAEVYGDNWWQGDWESYLFNMVADMRKDGAVKMDDWESIFIATLAWEEEGLAVHTFTLFPEDNKIYHEITMITE